MTGPSQTEVLALVDAGAGTLKSLYRVLPAHEHLDIFLVVQQLRRDGRVELAPTGTADVRIHRRRERAA